MQAPDFTLPDQNGKEHSLKDYAGKWLVLYFYPKDATPGCTAEACAFRDGRELLQNLGAEVVGISKDTTDSHAKFADKHNLNFTILSDRKGQVIKSYGSLNSKRFLGREISIINRDTYLIDPTGKIVKKYQGVDPAVHIKEVLSSLQQLTTQSR